MSCDMSELNLRIGIQDRVRYFDESQGGRSAAIVYNGHFVWPDGSNRELSDGGTGVLSDASWIDADDEQQVRLNLWWQKRFVERKLEDSIKEFEREKSALRNRASDVAVYGGVSPTKDEVKQLRRLRHFVKQWGKKLDVLNEKLNPQPEPFLRTKKELEVMRQNQDDASSILDDLQKIEV